ncbi:hypothetical protein D8S82_30325 [Mycobacterium hodleri]|uniref:HNH endonuclease n=1 Tax=Mycolicibacterium hodleri TaxID=49897 RepID=A0A544VS63_9MYCO|nr:hypothetical protein [Mycolicibacterium hodleri]TQR82819.1 hypothetical protein D8S82_30325 [Mycolicibacterium hodleri]
MSNRTRKPAKNTTARGLGWDHQENRRRLLNRHREGSPCWWCGRPMHRDAARNWDGLALHADHSRARARGGTTADRLLHDTCNKQRGDGTRDHLRPAASGPPADERADLGRLAMPWPKFD